MYDFWHTSPNFFLIRVGLLLAILSVTYAWCRWGAGQWGFSPLIQLGQTSLLVYWVHIEFVYGRLSILPKHAVGIRMASIGLAAIFVAMLMLSIWRTRWKGRGSSRDLRVKIFTAKFAKKYRKARKGSPFSWRIPLRPLRYVFAHFAVEVFDVFAQSLRAQLDRGLPYRVLDKLQRDCPALASLWFIVSVAEEIERDVEALPDFVFNVVKASPDQQFGGCGNLGSTFAGVA